MAYKILKYKMRNHSLPITTLIDSVVDHILSYVFKDTTWKHKSILTKLTWTTSCITFYGLFQFSVTHNWTSLIVCGWWIPLTCSISSLECCTTWFIAYIFRPFTKNAIWKRNAQITGMKCLFLWGFYLLHFSKYASQLKFFTNILFHLNHYANIIKYVSKIFV